MSSNEIKLMGMVDILKSQKEEIIGTTTETKLQVEELLVKFQTESSDLNKKILSQTQKLSTIDEEFNRSLSIFDNTVEKIEATSVLIKDNSEDISSSLNATNNSINDQAKSVKTTKDELELTIGYLDKLMSEQNSKLDNSVTDLTRLSEEMDTKILNTCLLYTSDAADE